MADQKPLFKAPYDLKDVSTYPNLLYKLLEREYSEIEIK